MKSAHLLVLEMECVNAAQRGPLEKIGARILDECDNRVPLAQPVYCVSLTFENEVDHKAFAVPKVFSAEGITRLRPDRGTHGTPHPRRVTACFENREDAATFFRKAALQKKYHFKVGPRSGPKKEAYEIRHAWVVEFPDVGVLESFRQAHVGKGMVGTATVGLGVLNTTERANLLDAIDRVREFEPADRRGERLTVEGAPAKAEFVIDVDLWHPGDAKQVSAAIREFRELVSRHQGRVTDGPFAVADTFFLARVRGNAATLDAVLKYDRVAFVDLPPQLPPMPSTIFDPIKIPDDGIPQPEGDAPLAGVVDSGILPTHPLLSGWVHDGRDFESGDETEIDQAGHGTHTAGIVVYGDVHRCVQEQSWRPMVRVVNAKVLRNNHGQAEFADDNDKRIETQLKDAISWSHKEHKCRVFNLSLGHASRRYLKGRQHPWALVLDELARSLDIVLVVSAGNVSVPAVPSVTPRQFQSKVLEQLLTDDHAIIDPASAMLALSVGSIARTDKPFKNAKDDNKRKPLVGAPAGGPSPFSRAGRVAETGAGPEKAVKPELVGYGGNFLLDESGHWLGNDVLLAEPSLNLQHQATGRLLRVATGTSVAAPYVTHICARVEHALRRLPQWSSKPPTANLVRALTVHSALVQKESVAWVDSTNKNPQRQLRLLGYGMPDPVRALRSTDQRVVLLTEDELEDEHYHIYELDIPANFAKLKTKRHIRVTLAYDPPVRGTRKEYLVRKLYFRLIKGGSVPEIEKQAQQGKDCAQPALRPGIDWVKDSTVQSACFDGTKPETFRLSDPADAFVRWHVVVRSEPRLGSDTPSKQRYALVVSLEHTDAKVRLYNEVRTRVEQRVKLSWS